MKHFGLFVKLFLFLYMTSLHALTPQIINFGQLVKAVEGGDDVKAIIHFDRCEINDEAFKTQFAQNLEGATTRFNFTKYGHFKFRKNGQLTDNVETSMNFIEIKPSDQIDSTQGRLQVFDDNTSELNVDFFDVQHNKLFAIQWTCDISNGHDNKGLVLFNSP